MKAARNFSFGDEDKNHVFKVGDDVPDKVVKALGDGANNLILELAAKNNPDILTRDQLLELAGIDRDTAEALDPDSSEFNEEEFREGMTNFSSKGDLLEWAESVLGIEGLNPKDNRAKIEDDIVSAMSEEPEEEDENE